MELDEVPETCFICNTIDTFGEDGSFQSQWTDKLTSTMSRLFDVEYNQDFQDSFVQELVCSKCIEILESVLAAYVEIERLNKTIAKSRKVVQDLLEASHNANEKKVNIGIGSEDEKKRSSLQRKILNSSLIKSSASISNQLPAEMVQVKDDPEDYAYAPTPDADESNDLYCGDGDYNSSPKEPKVVLNQRDTYSKSGTKKRSGVSVSRSRVLEEQTTKRRVSKRLRKLKDNSADFVNRKKESTNTKRALKNPNPVHRIPISEEILVKPNVTEVEKCPVSTKREITESPIDKRLRDEHGDECNDINTQLDNDGRLTYCCGMCGKSFQRRVNAKQHLAIHKNVKDQSPKSYQCTNCGTDFPNISQLKRHRALHASQINCTEDVNQVKISGTFLSMTEEEAQLTPTIQIDKSNKIYCCAICSKPFTQEEPARFHVVTHRPLSSYLAENMFPCNECSRAFRRITELETHMEMHKPPENRKYRCDLCQIGFSQKNLLKRHVNRHDPMYQRPPDKKQVCPVCGLMVVNLRSHLGTHSDRRPWECGTCGANFRLKKTLDIHIRTHTNERPYPCEKCPMKFKTSHGLARHLLLHIDEKMFRCEYCGRDFRFKAALEDHLHIHTKEKPFRCNTCGKRTKTREELDTHITVDHGSNARKKVRDNSWRQVKKGHQQQGTVAAVVPKQRSPPKYSIPKLETSGERFTQVAHNQMEVPILSPSTITTGNPVNSLNFVEQVVENQYTPSQEVVIPATATTTTTTTATIQHILIVDRAQLNLPHLDTYETYYTTM